MKRYWIHFGGPDLPIGFQMGCGITAHTQDDAMELLLTVWPKRANGPVISAVPEDIDLRSLDQKHIVPNIGDVTPRGVWFPNFG